MKANRPIIDFSFGRTVATILIYLVGNVLIRIPIHILYAMRIRGRRNLRSLGRRGFVTVSNHCLYGEAIFAGITTWPRRIWYCVEQENVDRKDVGWLCRLMGAFGIPDDRPMAIAGPVREALKRKHVVHIFPEGVLYFRNQDIAPVFPGAFYFALSNRAPVVPMVSVLRERKAWSLRLFRWLPPRVDFIIGEPVFPEPFLEAAEGRKAALAAFSDAVRSGMQAVIDNNGGTRNLPGACRPGDSRATSLQNA